MATTTNYSWVTPEDTDLVKDGAAAIRTLGSSIDTTVFNNASAAIAKSIVDAKGDLIAATGADTVSRLAVGSNDQVLIADSSTATGLKWGTPAAGGMTLLSTTALTGASTVISSIPSGYLDLKLYIEDIYPATTSSSLSFRLNGDTSAIYSYRLGTIGLSDNIAAETVTSVLTNSSASGNVTYQNTNNSNSFSLTINNYASTMYKTGEFESCYVRSNDTNVIKGSAGDFYYSNTSAITSITIFFDLGNISGGTAYLYGVK